MRRAAAAAREVAAGLHPIRERAQRALADPVLQRALPVATARAEEKRRSAWAELGVAEALREAAAAVRRHALSNLDHYLERFEASAQENGVHVHFAATRDEALTVIDGILADEGVRRVVKGKSMVTEELGLTGHLNARGVETWETDLGEFIVQLSGRPPSHVTAPAIHEDAASIAAIFRRELGVEVPAEPEALTRVARERLRESFLAADCGVTGANFLVAESGRVVLVENEGNIRLATLLPRVLVVVAGIEKVVPREADLPVLLALLARSATGQKLTTYTHSIRGPARDRDGEREGPEAVHVVLVDAGRTKILADEVARSALACIRCGACLNVCPVYRAIGGHSYGATLSGPIGAVTAPWLAPGRDAARLPMLSTLCGACEEVCPVKIPIPEQLLHLRARAVADPPGRGWRLEGFFVKGWAWSVASPGRMRRANRLARWALAPLARRGAVERLPPPLSGWTRHRDFPVPARRPLRERWREREREGGSS